MRSKRAPSGRKRETPSPSGGGLGWGLPKTITAEDAEDAEGWERVRVFRRKACAPSPSGGGLGWGLPKTITAEGAKDAEV